MRKLRIEKAWSQRHLAALLGLTASSVNKYETGATVPPVAVLLRSAKLFEVTLDQLVYGRPQEAGEGDSPLWLRFEQASRLAGPQRSATVALIDVFLAFCTLIETRSAPSQAIEPPPHDGVPTLRDEAEDGASRP